MPRKDRLITAGKVRQMVVEELIDRNRPDIPSPIREILQKILPNISMMIVS
jgi:hypothetical protein